MRLTTILLASCVTALMLAPSFAMADDWVATKLRGRVLQLVGNEWAPLHRGDVVSDERVVRTIKGGRVTFQRGNETIDLGGDTQIQIRDKSGRQFTTVQQYFGTVAIEADVRQVEHFAVTTPHLAAVVKGTRFTVISTGQGAKVSVQRGHVAVEDRDTQQTTLLAVGQSADTAKGTPLHVEGKGDLPVVYAASGRPVRTDASSPTAGLTPKAAAAAAREAALAAGASTREANQAAKAAEKEAKAAGKAAEKEAAATAYAAAVAAGASSKEAEKAAKEAAKEAKEEAKAAEHEARSESKGAENGNSGKGSDHGKSDDSGGSDGGKDHGKWDGGGSGNGNGGSGSSGDAGNSGSGEGNGASGGGGEGEGDSGGSGSGSGGDSGGGGEGSGKGHGKKD